MTGKHRKVEEETPATEHHRKAEQQITTTERQAMGDTERRVNDGDWDTPDRRK